MYKLLYFVTGTIANFINMDYNTISDLAKMSRNVYYEINNKNWLNKGSIVAAYQKIKESRNNRKFQSLTLNSQFENVKVYSLNLDFVGFEKDKSSFSYGFEYTYNDVNSRALEKN